MASSSRLTTCSAVDLRSRCYTRPWVGHSPIAGRPATSVSSCCEVVGQYLEPRVQVIARDIQGIGQGVQVSAQQIGGVHGGGVSVGAARSWVAVPEAGERKSLDPERGTNTGQAGVAMMPTHSRRYRSARFW